MSLLYLYVQIYLYISIFSTYIRYLFQNLVQLCKKYLDEISKVKKRKKSPERCELLYKTFYNIIYSFLKLVIIVLMKISLLRSSHLVVLCKKFDLYIPCQYFFVNKTAGCMLVAILEIHSGRNIFLGTLRNISERLFYKTTSGVCFCLFYH